MTARDGARCESRELARSQPLRECLHAIAERAVREGVEACADAIARDLAVGGEVVGDRTGEHWPLVACDVAAWPTVVARVDPSIPEGERNAKPRELGLRAARHR